MATKRSIGLFVIGLAAATCLSACGGGEASSADGALPSEIGLHVIDELSGPAGVAGVEIQKGYELAVKHINRDKVLGDHTIKLTFDDTGGKPTVGASLASQAVAKKYPIVFGSPVGGIALAEAPIFARAKQPTIFNEAGSEGVIASNYIFRMTPTIPSYYDKTLSYIQEQGVKTLAVVTNSDQPTLSSMAEEAKKDASKYGYEVVSYDSVISTQTDVAATVSKLLNSKADAVALLVQTGQNATFVKGLVDGGYGGLITASTSAGGGVLDPLGADADGVVWAANYTYQQDGEINKKFVADFNDAYDKNPTNWAAAAYDSMFFAARSLKEADSTDPAKIQAAMVKVGEEGFDGVVGRVSVTDNQQDATSGMVEWKNGEAVPIAQ